MQYGQVNTLTQTSWTSAYFTTEVNTALVTNKSQVPNEVLFSTTHIARIADTLWTGTPTLQIWGYNQAASMSLATQFHTKAFVRYRIRNMSNEPVTITAYYVKARKDIGQLTDGIASVYNILGEGFAEKTFVGPVNATTPIMTNNSYSPFESGTFTRNFKITRVRKVKIGLNSNKEFMIKKTTSIKPVQYFDLTATTPQTWRQKFNNYTYTKHSRFILFKLEGQASILTGQTDYMKSLGQTTPTVTMESFYNYGCRVLYVPQQTSGLVETAGIGTGVGNIMANASYINMAETDAG